MITLKMEHWLLSISLVFVVTKELDLVSCVDFVLDSLPPIRLKRDITERERDLVGVLQQYNTYVKPVSIAQPKAIPM